MFEKTLPPSYEKIIEELLRSSLNILYVKFKKFLWDFTVLLTYSNFELFSRISIAPPCGTFSLNILLLFSLTC